MSVLLRILDVMASDLSESSTQKMMQAQVQIGERIQQEYRQMTTITKTARLFIVTLAAAIVPFLLAPAAANAQAVGDEFASGGTTGNFSNDPFTKMNTGSQTTQFQQAVAPALQGATNGTIGPQGADATYVTGLNTAGTVRVNNLANLEALLNIIANGMEILGIAWGGPTMIMGFMHMAAGTQDAMKRVLFGAAGVTGGLATPGCINWLVASARDANLFN